MRNLEKMGMPEWLAKLVAFFGYSFIAAAAIFIFIMFVIIACRVAVKISDKLYFRSVHRDYRRYIKAQEAKHGKPYHS